MLPIGGFYKARRAGETHAWGAQTMHMMQMPPATTHPTSCGSGIARPKCGPMPPIHLRDLLDVKPLGKPIPIEEVESITSIRKRFVTPGMSLGALSP